MTTIEVPDTIRARLLAFAARDPERPFLCPAGARPLTAGGLGALAAATEAALAAAGIGAADRVALVTGNRTRATTAFLTAVCRTGVAPLNHRLTGAELADALAVPAIKAVLTDEPPDRAVWQAAAEAGRPVLRLHPLADGGAGAFRIDPAEGARTAGGAGPGDTVTADTVGLVLSTSGTTAKPKRVPLTNRNLVVGVDRLIAWLGLRPEDRVLSVMPLFHIHGIICTMLAPLLSGGSIQLIDPVTPDALLDALDRGEATWCTAVPTIYQSVATTLTTGRRAVPRHRLRFVRSSSAAMPTPLSTALEETFGVPVIEAYGMTEATHQMTSNPLPPRDRRPGSVGLAASVEVSIMDTDGVHLPRGTAGEVVIRGPSVTAGYEDNPDANRRSFTDGWFRTGDEGVIDADGYLTLTGRLKEMINRGGEKIAPLEVDRALADFPAVRDAITFAIPHPTLGEDVAAALVARPGQTIDQAELRRFLAARLAPFKRPQRFVLLDELPKGATGKLQRVGLADRLGLSTAATAAALGAAAAQRLTPLEAAIRGVWGALLRRPVEAIGSETSLVAAGGDSLLAVQLTLAVEEVFDVRLGWHPGEAAGTSVAGFAAAVTAARTAPGDGAATVFPGPIGERPAVVPATGAQRYLWDDSVVTDDGAHNIMVTALSLTGPGADDRIAQALDGVVADHEGLRTRWSAGADGSVVQTVAPPAPAGLERHDATALAEVRAAAAAWRAERLPPSMTPQPWQARLYRLAPDHRVLLLRFHAIVIDGLARERLVQELLARLDAADPAAPSATPPAAGPADLAVWEDRQWAGGAWDAGIALWANRLGRMFDLVATCSTGPAPPTAAGLLPLAFSADAARRIIEAAQRQGCTLFTLLLGATLEALGAVTGRDRLIVAVPAANRTSRESRDMVANLFQELFLIAEGVTAPNRPALRAALHAQVTEALAWQAIPVARVLGERLGLPRPPASLTALSDLFFQVRPAPDRGPWQVGGVTVAPLTLDDPIAYGPLVVEIERDPAGGLAGHIIYRTTAFDPATAQTLRDRILAAAEAWSA